MLTAVAEIEEVFEPILELSPADETELVWLERRHGHARSDEAERALLEPKRITVLVRVVERGRVGWHRTESGSRGDIEIALRQALALASLEPKARRLPVLPTTLADSPDKRSLFDPRIAALETQTALEQIQKLCRPDERATLHWSQHHLAVANSHGLRRRAEATEISLEFRAGRGPGAGFAAASARSLLALDAPEIAERARARRSDPDSAPGLWQAGSVPAVLAPEAVIELLNVLNIFALAGRAFLEGRSILARHRHVQVFDQAFELHDDPARLPGLPFPFDFEGSIKRPLTLVIGGRPELTALSQFQGGEVGMESTAASVGGQDALFGNLFLKTGELDRDQLLERAEGGLFIGWLDRPECFEPEQLRIRARARGVRRIRNGRLAESVPDLLWECSLLQALARLRGLGSTSVVRAMPSTPLGAISAPALALEAFEAKSLIPPPSLVPDPSPPAPEPNAQALSASPDCDALSTPAASDAVGGDAVGSDALDDSTLDDSTLDDSALEGLDDGLLGLSDWTNDDAVDPD